MSELDLVGAAMLGGVAGAFVVAAVWRRVRHEEMPAAYVTGVVVVVGDVLAAVLLRGVG